MSKLSYTNSKLPDETESIFSVMSGLAVRNNAVDLSQGFPNFRTDDYLKNLVTEAMREGFNQYAPPAGVPELREEILKKIQKLHGKRYDHDNEITLTSGATQALHATITAFIHPGDEVIVFKPAYDSYEPTVKLNGGTPILIQMHGPDFKINWKEVKNKISPKTRMLIINTPHNPSGTILHREDMEELNKLLKDTNIILLSDEVYEHIIFDGEKHHSASSVPGLAQRAVVCASFGKTFHNTGWKMGYCVAPEVLMTEIRKVHGLTVFCVNHPMQKAFAEYLKDPGHYLELGNFYQRKRDLFLSLIKNTRFEGKASTGTYFQVLDYSKITDEEDTLFSKRLTTEYKLTSIPMSVFNIDQQDHNQLRFCFAKTDETLYKAAEILKQVSAV